MNEQFKYFDIENIKYFLKKNKFNAQKKFGQNFLINERLCDFIVDSCDIIKKDLVLEIGCGLGNLTSKLLKTGCDTVGFEIDWGLIGELKSEFKGISQFKLIEGDFIKKFPQFIKTVDKTQYRRINIIGNLPYNITKPIFEKVFERYAMFDSIIFMVQKEYLEKIEATSESEKYNYISIITKLNYNFEIIANLSPIDYFPEPTVNSIVVKFDKKDDLDSSLKVDLLIKVVKTIFSSRRKTILNNFKTTIYFSNIEKEKILDYLSEDKELAGVRGESLEIEKIVEFTKTIEKIIF